MQYALRLCCRHGLKAAAVVIYSELQLFEEALDLALSVGASMPPFLSFINDVVCKMNDMELAKFVADAPVHDIGLQKKLWRTIGKKLASMEKSMPECVYVFTRLHVEV